MADNKSKKDYRDRSKVNTSEPYEMQYWTKKWDISSQQLVGATRVVGSGVKKIEKYLKDNNKL